MTPSEQEASMTREQLDLPRLRELALKATPGPWHHCQPYMVVPAQRTVHGTVPAERVDYVSTWPDRGTPPGHRVVIPMPTERGPGVRSGDMAFIAAANPATFLRLLDIAESAGRMREALALVRMSRGWQYMSDETRSIIDAALASSSTTEEVK